MNITDTLNLEMGAVFTVELFDSETNELQAIGVAKNMIVRSGYAFMAQGQVPADANIFKLGTGTKVESIEHTGLAEPLATKQAESRAYDPANSKKWTWTAYFEPNEAIMENGDPAQIREICVAWLNGPILNYALFKDPENNPITITKSNAQVMKITMQFEVKRAGT